MEYLVALKKAVVCSSRILHNGEGRCDHALKALVVRFVAHPQPCTRQIANVVPAGTAKKRLGEDPCAIALPEQVFVWLRYRLMDEPCYLIKCGILKEL